jgi:uncharacterized cupin superfamily protein
MFQVRQGANRTRGGVTRFTSTPLNLNVFKSKFIATQLWLRLRLRIHFSHRLNDSDIDPFHQERHMSTITFTRIDAKGPGASGLNPALHDPADVILEGARAPHALNAYSDATNMLSAGVWQCDAGTLKLADLPIHEVCVLIEGEVVITSDDGRSERYAAGDAFILHKGFSGTWHMPVATKKYSIVYCG